MEAGVNTGIILLRRNHPTNLRLLVVLSVQAVVLGLPIFSRGGSVRRLLNLQTVRLV